MLRSLVGLLFALTLLCSQTAFAVPVNTSFENSLWGLTGAQHGHIVNDLYVSATSPESSDTNSGSLTSPLRTIQKAIDLAKPGTCVVIEPGVYRESLTMEKARSGTAANPVIIKAEKPGTVVLTGSDQWTGWQKAEDTTTGTLYSHSWPYQWGGGVDPFANAAPMGVLGRRCEMVFVNGVWYRQVLDRAQLKPNCFWVSDAQKTIVLEADAGTDIAQADVEVAVRRQAIDMGGLWGSLTTPHKWPNYYGISGLTIEHYTCQGDYALPAIGAYGSHFLLDNCTIAWNNGTGLAVRGTDIVIRNCRCVHNGYCGISIPPTDVPAVHDILFKDDLAADNNWRGAEGNFYGYAVAGMKLMTSTNVILDGFVSRNNESAGVWFDNSNRNFLIENSQFIHNQSPGLWLEISQGPFLVRHCVFTSNPVGLRISNSAQITATHNIFYSNAAQIDEWSPGANRGGFYDVGLTLLDNVFDCTDNTQALWRRPDYPNISETLTSDGNLWWRPDGAGWFVGSDKLDFSQWIVQTHQDQNSLMADPRFAKPSADNFTPLAGSPLRKQAGWGHRTVVDVVPASGLSDSGTQIYMDAIGVPGPIHYTLNGETPSASSPVYAGPFPYPNGGEVKALVLGHGPALNPIASVTLVGGAPPTPDTSISTLTPTKDVVGWGGYAHTNLSIQGQPLRVDGISFPDGMGAHAPSELDYVIPAGVARFVAVVGLDDEVLGQGAHPSVVFSVYADDLLLYKSNTLTPSHLGFINVAIPAGAKTLRLMVAPGSASQDWDHADWVRAGFINK